MEEIHVVLYSDFCDVKVLLVKWCFKLVTPCMLFCMYLIIFQCL